MQVPPKIPALKWLTVLLGIYFVLWIGLEGSLAREAVMGVGLTAVSLLHLLQNRLGNQTVSLKTWLGVTAVLGLLLGLGSGPLTIIAMILKTGLHAHGPEFTIAQIQWVWQQAPLWALVGLLSGLGLGLLTANK